GPTARGARFAFVDTPFARAYNRCWMLRHGRHLRPQARKLRDFPSCGQANARRVAPAGNIHRLDRMQHVPLANGRGGGQTNSPPGPVPGPGVRSDAGNQPEIALMKVRLFARARELVGADAIDVELPAGATVGDLRTQIARTYPALARLLERSALAVNNEFAD